MTTDNTADDYKPELDDSDHRVIEVLTQLKEAGNPAALTLLRTTYTPEQVELNAIWRKSNSDTKRRREEHERDEADRQRYENSLTGASRIAAILRRNAGVGA